MTEEQQQQTAAESHKTELEAYMRGEKTVKQLAEDLKVVPLTIYRWLDQLGMKKRSKRKKRAKATAPISGNGPGATPMSAVQPPHGVSRDLATLIVSGGVNGTMEEDIAKLCANLASVLIARQRIGTMVHQVRFSQASPAEQVNIRIDGYLSSIMHGQSTRATLTALLEDLSLKLIYDHKSA